MRARLLNVAKATGADFNLVLVRFALERLLFRLSTSDHADRFVLKGALLFTLWYDLPHRATCARLPAGVELAYDGQVLEIHE